MKQTDSSIIIVRNVCVLTSASMIVYLFVTRSWSAVIGTKQPKVNQSPQQCRGRYTCTRICRFLIVVSIFRLETCMNSLVKVPPYSKLNFQGNNFFTQNWCNINLIVTDADTNDQSNKAGARYVFPIYTHYKERNLIFPHYGTRRINVAYSIWWSCMNTFQNASVHNCMTGLYTKCT